jgi:phosphoadenosine phosphosulfate reductase
MLSPEETRAANEHLVGLSTPEVLAWAWERFGFRAAIGTGFQGAGLVLMHLAAERGLPFPVFTIDTGLLFPESVRLKARLEQFFGRPIEVLVPDLSVEQQAAVLGPELWRRDPDLCCFQRKVLPLQSRLGSLDCWITGLRREQSDTRAGIELVEVYRFDEAAGRDIVKLNPMAGWSREAVWRHLHRHAIPYHPLHDRGYRSIGCQPCTAPSGNGAGERAGRWIGFQKTECGIHTFLKRKE